MQTTPFFSSRFGRLIELCAYITLMLVMSSILGTQTRANIPDWYDHLAKPPLQPPAYVFGIVWTLLYITLGVVFWRLTGLARKGVDTLAARRAFIINIVLNWAWTPIFFGAHLLLPAALWLLAVWASAVWLVKLLLVTDKRSAWLLAPYIVWLSFAAYLSFGVWMLNG